MIITGEYIKRLRESMELSQSEVAKAAGISQAHVAKIENNKVDPRLSTVNNILSALENSGERRQCRHFMKNPFMIGFDSTVNEAIKTMKKNSISQLPVIKKDEIVGSLKESTIIEKTHRGFYDVKIGEIMDKPFPVLDLKEDIEITKTILDFSQAVLISKRGKIVGIITKTDLL